MWIFQPRLVSHLYETRAVRVKREYGDPHTVQVGYRAQLYSHIPFLAYKQQIVSERENRNYLIILFFFFNEMKVWGEERF